MKKLILIAILAIGLASCGNKTKKSGIEGNTIKSETAIKEFIADPNVVYVYYFHGKQRCKTCLAVEEQTKKTVDESYKDNKQVKYVEVNTSEKKYEKLVEKYEISWNALIVAKGEDFIDLTEKAFANAVNKPEKVDEMIKNEVSEKLK